MDYNEFRAIAQDGDIFFLSVDTGNILSLTTSFFTKSKFTHAAFVFWYKNRLLVVESTTHGGLRIANASEYRDREITYVPAPVPWEDIEPIALQKIGTIKYGWVSATYIGARDVLHRWFNWHLPPLNSNRNMACSEFVSLVLGYEDIDIPPSILYDKLTAAVSQQAEEADSKPVQ